MRFLQKLSREKRLIVILGALAVVLLAIVLLARSCGKDDAVDEGNTPDDGSTVIIPTDEVTAMEYYNGTAFLSFAKNEEDAWYWTQDPLFPLDETYPAAVAQEVQGLSATTTIGAGEGDTLESYGLDSSDLYIKTTSVGGNVSTLLIGNKLDTGEYYVRFEESETVYVVSAALMEAVSLDINDMAVIEPFPVLDETNIATLTVQGTGEDTLTYTVKEEGEGTYNWYQSGRAVNDDPTLKALLAEIAALSFDACIDYRPSEEALGICGITAPLATLTVEYMIDGVAAELQLIIGEPREDGATHFAALAPDGTIYSIAHDSAATLLSIAETLVPTEEETA